MQLADKWLLKCNKILQSPYSSDAYINALKEAEQFLWAGHEMDPVSFNFVLLNYLFSFIFVGFIKQ